MKMLNRVFLSSILGISLFPVMANASCHYGQSIIFFKDGPYFGPVTCDAGSVSSLTVFGPTRTVGTIINGDVKVIGLFEGQNTEVFGKFTVLGPVNLTTSSIHEDASLATDTATFSGSSIDKNIVIKSDTSADIYLKNNSIVKGDIQFESRNRGKVHIEDGSTILGQIKNGNVVT